ncbi:MAG TPA: glycosyl hydrolase family 65 protein, partial [Nocardioidaceae bacterium]|nr:glycosyl hydrolase family 65 protein [Nocardioidaceae bacterium]
PVATETHAAGVWADIRDLAHDAPQPEGAVNLPGWTTLRFSDGTATYQLDQGTVRDYHQSLDLRSGTVTSRVVWQSPAGRVTDLRYDVLLDRARPRTGVVRLRVTPQWTGTAAVTDVLGEGFDYHPDWISAGLERGTEDVSPAQHTAQLTVRTKGTGIDVAYADHLATPTEATVNGTTKPHTTELTATFPVRAGRTYTTTKTIGFATSQDTDHPVATARDAAATGSTGFRTIHQRSASAWSELWRSDILVPGRPELQRQLRAAQFYLMASVALPGQPGEGWSLSPVGLSGDGYNNHVFWDTETWMYPALLALHPDLARSLVDYRYRTRDGARSNAENTGYDGLRFAWESALTGREVTPGWAETGELEQHITGDVALAQWQYYLATGDQGWLADRGWPVLQGAARFWASRATRNDDGSWSINRVEGPDEHHFPVDDSVYTNVAASTTLRLATKAAGLVGETAPQRWRDVADGLVVLPADEDGVRPEFRGYTGDQVKQADAVMLTYPWEFPQPRRVDLADLRYYAARYDPDGPAMTDSVNSIVWSQLRPPGCANWTWTRRSLDPFVKPPYAQFTEARSGQGVFTFLTGEGGFLQEFLYGYPGLRWRGDHISLDPTLPPQLEKGLTVRGLHWHGRVFDVRVERSRTTVSLRSGAPTELEAGGRRHLLAAGAPVTVSTARPDSAEPDNVALCRPVMASSADPSSPAVAAVDGERVTGWAPTSRRARLNVDLGRHIRPDRATLTWTGAGSLDYRLQLRNGNGPRWRTVATGSASGKGSQHLAWKAHPASALRLVVHVTEPGLQLGELEVGAPRPRR